jgi:hypothetical protein
MAEAKWLVCDEIEMSGGKDFCVFPMESRRPRERCIRHGRLLMSPVHGEFRDRAQVRKHLLRPENERCIAQPCRCGEPKDEFRRRS